MSITKSCGLPKAVSLMAVMPVPNVAPGKRQGTEQNWDYHLEAKYAHLQCEVNEYNNQISGHEEDEVCMQLNQRSILLHLPVVDKGEGSTDRSIFIPTLTSLRLVLALMILISDISVYPKTRHH